MNRNEQIRELRKQGKMLWFIGRKFGITHQRVAQICLNDDVAEPIKVPCFSCGKECLRYRVTVATCDDCHKKYFFRKSGKEKRGLERTRVFVRIRDKFRCRDCGTEKYGKKDLDIHHLGGLCGKMSRSYDKISSIDNLITLCHRCHFNRPDHTLKTRNRPVDKPHLRTCA